MLSHMTFPEFLAKRAAERTAAATGMVLGVLAVVALVAFTVHKRREAERSETQTPVTGGVA